MSDERDKIREYWNNSGEERAKKTFYVTDPEAIKESVLNSKYIHFKDLVDVGGGIPVAANVLSIACGNCWLEARAFNDYSFKNLTGIDYSEHRVREIAPDLLSNYGIPKNQYSLYAEDLFEHNFDGEMFDVIILNQAFHHFDNPQRLLELIDAILSENGKIVITGEHYFSFVDRFVAFLKYYPKFIINHKGRRKTMRLLPHYEDLFPHCPIKGDNHYPDQLYVKFASYFNYEVNKLVDRKLRVKSFVFLRP